MSFRVVPFEPFAAGAFREINLQWIRAYFRVEAHDEAVLADPAQLVRDGGFLFMALDESIEFDAVAAAADPTTYDDPRVLGVCALLQPPASNASDGAYELAKMGVRPSAQGRGVGAALGQAALDKAREVGAPRVDLLSNRRLAPAMRLYERLGFVEGKLPQTDYERADIFMEIVFR